MRLEQLHPFPETQLKQVVERYPKAEAYFWVQEEPENMGPWGYLRRKFKLVRTRLIARAESSSPATGISLHHQQEQQAIVDHAFGEALQHQKVVDITES